MEMIESCMSYLNINSTKDIEVLAKKMQALAGIEDEAFFRNMGLVAYRYIHTLTSEEDDAFVQQVVEKFSKHDKNNPKLVMQGAEEMLNMALRPLAKSQPPTRRG